MNKYFRCSFVVVVLVAVDDDVVIAAAVLARYCFPMLVKSVQHSL